jgi:hypothetical protein
VLLRWTSIRDAGGGFAIWRFLEAGLEQKKKKERGWGASLGFAAPPFFCFMFFFLGFLVMASPLGFLGIVPL